MTTLAGHAVNTSLNARLGHPWPRTVPPGWSFTTRQATPSEQILRKDFSEEIASLTCAPTQMFSLESGTRSDAIGAGLARGTVCGRDAARERTGMYSQRVP